MGKGWGIRLPPLNAKMRADVERMKLQFELTRKTTFKAFFEEFEAVEFHKIYANQMSDEVYVQFAEELLQVAVGYIEKHYDDRFPVRKNQDGVNVLKNAAEAVRLERPIIDRIFGCYLLYALFEAQPARKTVRIFIGEQQFDEMIEFVDSDASPPDVKTVINDLLDMEAFKCTPCKAPFWGPQELQRYHLKYWQRGNVDGYTSDPFAIAFKVTQSKNYRDLMRIVGCETLGEAFSENMHKMDSCLSKMLWPLTPKKERLMENLKREEEDHFEGDLNEFEDYTAPFEEFSLLSLDTNLLKDDEESEDDDLDFDE